MVALASTGGFERSSVSSPLSGDRQSARSSSPVQVDIFGLLCSLLIVAVEQVFWRFWRRFFYGNGHVPNLLFSVQSIWGFACHAPRLLDALSPSGVLSLRRAAHVLDDAANVGPARGRTDVPSGLSHRVPAVPNRGRRLVGESGHPQGHAAAPALRRGRHFIAFQEPRGSPGSRLGPRRRCQLRHRPLERPVGDILP